MKTLFSIFAVVVLVLVANAATVVAQCDPSTKNAVYEEFLANRKRPWTIEKLEKAIASGKRYIEMCKDSQDDVEIVAFIKKNLTNLEQGLATEVRFSKFEKAVEALNYSEAYKIGREIFENEPKDSELRGDLSIYLTWAGYKATETAELSTTLDVIEFGKQTLELINNNAVKFIDWGINDARFKENNEVDSRSRTLAWINFWLGDMYERVNNKKEAMTHYFLSTGADSSIPVKPAAYNRIGLWYITEAIKLQNESKDIEKANGDQETEESTERLRMARGYADRAFEAYSRAYLFSKTGSNPQSADRLRNGLLELYKFWYDGAEEGLDQFIMNITKGPFRDPRNPVEPIIEEEEPKPAEATQG